MQYRIALIPGDGIGPEVVKAGVQVLETVAAVCGFTIVWTDFPYSCTYHLVHGGMISEDGFEMLRQHDAILLGAVGDPRLVPDHALEQRQLAVDAQWREYVYYWIDD